MIVNQDKLFSTYVTMLRTIWNQTRKNLADSSDLSFSLDNNFGSLQRSVFVTHPTVFLPPPIVFSVNLLSKQGSICLIF